MGKKKQITPDIIIEWYMEIVSANGKPISEDFFIENFKINESDFYKHFSNFEEIDRAIFGIFAKETINLLNESDEFYTYSPQDKLLSFYYTFFELLTANRAYTLAIFKEVKSNFTKLSILKDLRKSFNEFINQINIEKLDFKNQSINTIQDNTIATGYWIQFLFLLNFWIKDTSDNFEKTDALIEKIVKVSFDIQQVQAIKSVVDLAKFLWKEK